MLPESYLSRPAAVVEPVEMWVSRQAIHHIHGPPGPVSLGRRRVGESGMRPDGVVKVDPLAGDGADARN